jgi:hypothetical protein
MARTCQLRPLMTHSGHSRSARCCLLMTQSGSRGLAGPRGTNVRSRGLRRASVLLVHMSARMSGLGTRVDFPASRQMYRQQWW